MPHRRTWPQGLRIVYWLSVVGLTVGVAQMLYWQFVTHEFFPQLTLQGGYAIVAFAFGAFCVAAGALNQRRTFAVAALITTAFHLCGLALFSFQTWSSVLPELMDGRVSLLEEGRANAGVIAWNSFALVGHLLVCYYLLRYEFRVFGNHAAK